MSKTSSDRALALIATVHITSRTVERQPRGKSGTLEPLALMLIYTRMSTLMFDQLLPPRMYNHS